MVMMGNVMVIGAGRVVARCLLGQLSEMRMGRGVRIVLAVANPIVVELLLQEVQIRLS